MRRKNKRGNIWTQKSIRSLRRHFINTAENNNNRGHTAVIRAVIILAGGGVCRYDAPREKKHDPREGHNQRTVILRGSWLANCDCNRCREVFSLSFSFILRYVSTTSVYTMPLARNAAIAISCGGAFPTTTTKPNAGRRPY